MNTHECTYPQLYTHTHTHTYIHTYIHVCDARPCTRVSAPVDGRLNLPQGLGMFGQLVVSGLEVHPIMEFSHFYCLHIRTKNEHTTS